MDDAVLGRLPAVCIKDGTPAASRLRIIEQVGRPEGLGVLWLLLLLGPIGWVVLAVVWAWPAGERLAIEVPMSDAAYDRFTEARKNRTLAGACSLLGIAFAALVLVGSAFGLIGDVLVVGTVAGLLAMWWVADGRFRRASVGVALDASRRWVTLRRVHPTFAAACDDKVSSDHAA